MIKLLPIPLFFLAVACSHQPTQQDRQPANTELSGSLEIVAEESPYAPRESLRPQVRPAGLNTSVSRPGASNWTPPALSGVGTHFNSNCRNFIQRDGSLGPWGRQMVDAMHEVQKDKGRNVFFGSSGSGIIRMGSRCRSTEHFQSLSREQQEHVWVWLWASVAQAESSCNPRVQVNGIWNPRRGRYNRADGLFQLEYHTQTRNDNGRDTTYCLNGADSQAIRFQTRCAASIMADTQGGDFLKDGNSYWLKLRRNGGQIFNLLRRHPLCR